MTIGELFIKLGFKVEGEGQLDQVDRGMNKAKMSATKLTIEVAALNAAFFLMIQNSMKAAVGLRNFVLSTGLSADSLQQWQHVARVNGVEADDLTAAIKGLQEAQSNFALNKPESVGVWSMLGINPMQDPFKVIEALRRRATEVKDVGVFRNLLGQLGLENLLPILRSTDQEFEKWKRVFIIPQGTIDQLGDLNKEWVQLKDSIHSVMVQFSTVFKPVLSGLAAGFQWVTEKLAQAVHWLNSASPAARFIRVGLQALVVVLLALGVALTSVVTAFGTLTALLGTAAFATFLAGLLPIVAAFTLWATLIAAVILLVDDLWTSIHGGQSAFDEVADWVLQFDAVRRSIEAVIAAWDQLRGKTGRYAWITQAQVDAELSAKQGGGSTVTNNHETSVKVEVNGAQNPKAVGDAVVSALAGHLRAAQAQSPVPSR